MSDTLLYYPAALPATLAVTLVVHGLNVKPAAMEPLITWLTHQGSAVYLVQLSGHYESGTPIKEVTPALWQEEMSAGYHKAKQATADNGVPLYFLGYSLGALLGQTMIILQQESACFDRQVLLAPATAIRTRSYLLRLLFFLGKQWMLPSFTPEAYRANKALPLHIYQCLFAEEKKLLKGMCSQLDIPTLIILDPKDELISYQKLQRLIKQYKLTQSKVLALHHHLEGRAGRYHHLILNEETMGATNWQLATNAMQQFLFQKD